MIIALLALALQAPAAEIPLPPEFVPVQESFFRRSYAEFTAKVSAKLPDMKLPPPLVFTPAFRPQLSRRGWIETFVNEISEKAELADADRRKLRATTEDLFFSYHHDEGYPRFPYLAASEGRVLTSGVKQTGRDFSLPLPLPASFPNEPHTLNLKAYVDERFPVELQDFVRDHHVSLLLDRQGCVRSLRDSERGGYPRIIRFSNPRDYAESPTYFAQTADGKTTRFVVCDLYGDDDVRRARAMYGPSFAKNGGRLVQHADRDTVLKLQGESVPLRARNSGDLVLVGFQNTVWWQLKMADPAWERKVVTDDGAEVSVFVRATTDERIVSVANIFGDEMIDVLQTFYNRGYRRFIYLGTAGGLDPILSIGDLLVPTKFRDGRGRFFAFENHGLKRVLNVPAGNHVWRASVQGWVPNLIVETQPYLSRLRDEGVQAIDIEAMYFARFFGQHPAAEHSEYILVSDLPLHGASYDKEDASRDRPMKSLKQVLPVIMGLKPSPAQ